MRSDFAQDDKWGKDFFNLGGLEMPAHFAIFAIPAMMAVLGLPANFAIFVITAMMAVLALPAHFGMFPILAMMAMMAMMAHWQFVSAASV
jgi:hypothetical protein